MESHHCPIYCIGELAAIGKSFDIIGFSVNTFATNDRMMHSNTTCWRQEAANPCAALRRLRVNSA